MTATPQPTPAASLNFPTVGRVVYYQPIGTQLKDGTLHELNSSQGVLAAHVCDVNQEKQTVCLLVITKVGMPVSRTDVPFVDGASPTHEVPHAHWMPYQLAAQTDMKVKQPELIPTK